MGLVLHILVLVAIYSILAIALNIQVGMAGLFNLGLAAFFGIGAYTSAILSLTYHVPVWLSLIAGMLMAGLVGFIIGLPALRLVGDYLAVVTMGLGEIAAVFKNWVPVTNGPMGLRGIPHVSLFGLSINTTAAYLAFGAVVLVLVYVVTERIRLSPFGRVLRGVREDEVGAQALGRNTYWFKMLAFVVGCAVSGIAGRPLCPLHEFHRSLNVRHVCDVPDLPGYHDGWAK